MAKAPMTMRVLQALLGEAELRGPWVFQRWGEAARRARLWAFPRLAKALNEEGKALIQGLAQEVLAPGAGLRKPPRERREWEPAEAAKAIGKAAGGERER